MDTEKILLASTIFFALVVLSTVAAPTDRYDTNPNPPAFGELLALRPPAGHPESDKPIVFPTSVDVMPSLEERTWVDYAILFGSAALCIVLILVFYWIHLHMSAHYARMRQEQENEKMELAKEDTEVEKSTGADK